MKRLLVCAITLPAAIVALGAASLGKTAPDADLNTIVDGMIHEQNTRSEHVGSWSRLQHYSATSDRFNLKAEVTIRIHRDRLNGKTYEVVSRTGSPTIQTHVFDPLLQAEVETSHQTSDLLTRENYSFRVAGQEERAGRDCWVLETVPKRKDKRLLRGKLWVDKADFGIVHAEGRPAESLSFWVGRPTIVQDYTKQAGFWWVSERRSYDDSFWMGKAELVIDYTDYQFEPRAIEASTGH